MMPGCPGSQKFKRPQPENIKCPFCGGEVEIWTDEFEAVCPGCKKTVSRGGEQSCLDWCKEARKCVGDEIYERYLKNKNKPKEKEG